MQNLLKETIEVLDDHGKSFSDVHWIGTREGYIDKTDFLHIANCEYNDSYGTQYINHYLVIVGDHWWLERRKYDGSEWWEFKTKPNKPETKVLDINEAIFYNQP